MDKNNATTKKRGATMLFKAFLFSIMILGSAHMAFAMDINRLSATGTSHTLNVGSSGNPLFIHSGHVGHFWDNSANFDAYIPAVSSHLYARIPLPTFSTGSCANLHFNIHTVDGAHIVGDTLGTTSGSYCTWDITVAYAGAIGMIQIYGDTGTGLGSGTMDGDASTSFSGYSNVTGGWVEDGTMAFELSSSAPATCFDGIQNQDETGIDTGGVCSTRIISFTPADSSTPITSPVTFTLDSFINATDISGIVGVKITIHNIDQNVLILSQLSPSDVFLLDSKQIQSSDLVSSGANQSHFMYTSSPITLGDGNYRVDVSLERSYLGGWIVNPWSSINSEMSHSFVVGAPTFIGNISNNMFKQVNDITGAIGGSSTASDLAGTCLPISGSFDVIQCMHFLFVPDAQQLHDTFMSAKDGILTRVPWGYVTRFVTILSDPSTVSLPTISDTFPTNGTGDTLTVSFDPGDMLAGAGTVIDSIHDPLDSSVNFSDTFKPMVALLISLAVLLEIIADLTGSHRHHAPGGNSEKRKLS
jgi:hypothetical protein